MMNQTEMVLKYLNDFGSITPLQAFADLGIMRLSARISDLKRQGVKIETSMVGNRNRYGKAVRYAEYRISKGD